MYGQTSSTIINTFSAAMQRFVTVGPGDASLGDSSASSPQLYMSIRDYTPNRGVHAVGRGLPTRMGTANNTLLQGMGWYQGSTSNLTTPLVLSFCFQGPTVLWTCDTQGCVMGGFGVCGDG